MITAWIGSISLLFVAVLYILLAFGLPYGDFAMGGKYTVMPVSLRIACSISVLIQVAAMIFLLQTGQIVSISFIAPIAREVCYVFAVYLFFNTVMNFFSRSKKEKLVMTPLSLLTAICFLITALNG
ncbi:hypothetical protein LCM20_16365 [Halobacillus litoralis]|uniref:hypothetical protein n=1 Tax=Halobacillus litoralis TaxID=45668 RepID=UPI001CD34859|nr:hypothetical protein [Halobacillus litoralis]MCA0972183.1 hypothetical protein [Halobacillus litoralis]